VSSCQTNLANLLYTCILFSSRSSIAKDAGKENFNLQECETAVVSGLSDSATLDDVRSAVISCEKILKDYRSSSINDSNDSIKKVELMKVKLHQKNIHIRTQDQPSDEDKLLARELVRKPLSKLKSDKRGLMEDVREFNVSLVNSVSAIKKSINAIEVSTQEKAALWKLHAELLAIVHQATKAEIGTATESPSHVADLMKQLYHRSDLIEECISLMSMEKYSHIPALAVLQKKFELLEEGLSSMKTDSPMDQSIFLKRWDALEDEEAKIISSATCEEGLYVDEKGNIVPPGTKDAIELIPPGGKFALNKMTGVRRGLLTMLIKHWHPNLPDGWLETILEMLENEVPPNLESDLKNGCITAWTNLITSILHSEAGGQVTTELIEAVKESMSFNDNFDLFVHTKKFPLVQFAKAAEMLSINMLQLVLRSKSRELAQVVTNKLEGSPSSVGICSRDVFVDHYTLVGAGITTEGDTVVAPLQHGQALCNPDVYMSLTTITPKALDAQSLSTGILFSNMNDIHVSSFSDSMGIASGRSGEDISDDAYEEIRRAMFYQRSKNSVQAFKKCIEKGVGIPKMFLVKCQAEGIVATIDNAQSLFNTYLMNRGLHPFQLAAQNRLASLGIFVSAKEALSKLPKYLCDHNIGANIGNLSRAASVANRDGAVDIDALAKTRDEPVSRTRRSLDNTKRSQNLHADLSRAASVANRNEAVDIDTLAESRGQTVRETREKLDNTKRSQNFHADLSRVAATSNRGNKVDLKALAESRGQTVRETREKLDNTKRSQNLHADLSRAASASNEGKDVDIDALAKARGQTVRDTREKLDNTKQAMNKFKTMMKDKRKQVVAEFDSTIIGTFAMAGHKSGSGRYAKRYSLQARLEQMFDNKAIPGISKSPIEQIMESGGRLKLLCMTLRAPHDNEEFTEAQLKTGFRVDVPEFTNWQRANTLIEITHHDGSRNKKPCKKGTIYKTESQIDRTKRFRIRCGCAKGEKCNNGKEIEANKTNAFGIEENIIPFGTFLP